MPESTSAALDAFRAPLSTIGEAELVVVVGDDEVVDRAPAVDLWLRKARRAGAEIVTIGARGATQAGPGTAAEALAGLVSSRSALGKRLRESERAVLVWSGPGGGGGARLAEAAHALGFEGKPGCAAFHLPATPNARGVAEAWACAADEDETVHELDRPARRLGRRGGLRPRRARPRRARRRRDRDHDVPFARGRLGRPRAARDRGARARGHRDEPRGPRPALPPGRHRHRCRTSSPGSRGSPSGSTSSSRRTPRSSSTSSRSGSTAGSSSTSWASGRRCRRGRRTCRRSLRGLQRHMRRRRRCPRTTSWALCASSATRRSSPARRSSASPSCSSSGRTREVALSAPDADRRGIATGDTVSLRSNGTSVELRARVDRKLVEGVARIAVEHAADLHLDVEVVKA